MNLKIDLSPKKILGIAIALLVVLLVCAYKVNTNPSGISLTGVIFASVALAVLALFAKIDAVIGVLRDELEPKAASNFCTCGSVSGCTCGANSARLAAAKKNLADSAQRLGGIWAEACGRWDKTLDIAYQANSRPHPVQCQASSFSMMSACNCGPNQGCIVCASSGAQADRTAEAEILDKGLTAPRVTAEQVQALMNKLTWRYEHEAGSRHTFAHAFLGDFYIATGHNAPISRENFNAELGMKYAREQAEGKARDKLWELEGYKLWASQAANQAQ